MLLAACFWAVSLLLAQDTRSFTIEGAPVPFAPRAGTPALLSASCAPTGKKAPDCEAWAAYLAAPAKARNAKLSKFGNPAAAVCEAVGGMKIIGRDAKQNEFLFCGFKDGSMINASALLSRRQGAQ